MLCDRWPNLSGISIGCLLSTNSYKKIASVAYVFVTNAISSSTFLKLRSRMVLILLCFLLYFLYHNFRSIYDRMSITVGFQLLFFSLSDCLIQPDVLLCNFFRMPEDHHPLFQKTLLFLPELPLFLFLTQ